MRTVEDQRLDHMTDQHFEVGVKEEEKTKETGKERPVSDGWPRDDGRPSCWSYFGMGESKKWDREQGITAWKV